MIRHVTVAVALSLALLGSAVAEERYRLPPPNVVKVLETPPLPSVSLDPGRRVMLLLHRVSLPSIEEISQPMLRLAGYRINPATNGRHGPARIVGITFKDIASGKETEIVTGAELGSPRWSPDGQRFALTMTRENGIELWVGNAQDGGIKRLTGPVVNTVMGGGFQWLPDSQHLLVQVVPKNRGPLPERSTVPVGPVVRETSGQTAPVRTYQDLLKSPDDERLFKALATSELVRINVDGGEANEIGAADLYSSVSVSPDGKYLLVRRIQEPFSYLVTARSFPESVEVWSSSGERVRQLASLPLRDAVPVGGVETGPRGHGWSASRPHTLIWSEALDGGDPRAEVPHRDRLVVLDAPADGEERELLKTEHRYTGTQWLQDPRMAFVSEYDRDRRWARTWLVDVEAAGKVRLIWERNVQDRYADPGRPVTTPTPAGRSVVLLKNDSIYLSGRGATPDGDRPFLDRMSLDGMETERLWQCAGENFESVVDLLDDNADSILTTYETKDTPPNYFVRNLADDKRRQITEFVDPAPELREVKKQLVHYQRDDGVPLSATLYLPAGHKEGERLPLVVWAYPREFNDVRTAGQVSGSPYRFTSIGGISHLFFLTQGYAVMDGATMPVIGDPETCNDTFVEQIVAAAKAAIDKAVAMGVADPDRVGVGGHSYGAFMTANLLAHCDLFRAGIARSGAYNRTLTPFGFQSERRTFWEAPMTYFAVSPFMHADKLKEPILLIHGQVDNNSGTFPLQSERYYHALKGHGGTARLVMLPNESHGYRAKESVYHTLAEMIEWFDQHVKGAASQ